MITWSQIQNATLDQVKTNPELLNAIVRAYNANGASVTPAMMLARWESGARPLSGDIAQINNNIRGINSGAWWQSALDTYMSRNYPGTDGYKSAQETRNTALNALNSIYEDYKSMGIDISDNPQYKQYQSAFNISNNETTAGKTAEQILNPQPTTTPTQQTGSTTNTSATAGKTTTVTPNMQSDMTVDKLMSDPRVKNDKGFNGVTMAEWLQGNATLIPKLASLGYTVDDLINEAYSQTRTNKSAFSKDMTTTGRLENVASGTQSGTTPTSPVSVMGGDVNTADQKWVNDLYQKYFDRTATSAELSNWAKENPTALESFLKSEAARYGYTSKATQTTRDAATKQALSEWNAKATAAGFPQELIDMGAAAISAYSGDVFDNTEIINTFNKIKNETIDPYYKELVDIAIKDFTTANQNLMTDRERELEAERATAGQNIRQAKEGQEAAGMTFTGNAIQNLGAESAYAQEPTSTVTTPTQTPFGGMFYEGTVNQANRLISTSSAARYAQAQQALGRKAEDYLGTSGASGLGINYTPAGVTKTSELETAKQKDYASKLQALIDQYKTKQNLLTNI